MKVAKKPAKKRKEDNQNLRIPFPSRFDFTRRRSVQLQWSV